MLSYFQIFSFSLILLIVFESTLRINKPTSKRPSILLSDAAQWPTDWAYFLGRQVARLTDVLYFLRELLGQDIRALWNASIHLVIAPSYFIRGYVTYYLSALTTTPLVVALGTLCVLLISIAFVFPQYTFGIFAVMNSLDTETKNIIAFSAAALVPIIAVCVIFPVCELVILDKEDEEISSQS